MRYMISLFAACSLLVSSCNYLDMVPENDIETIETIFEKREQAEEWFKTCYTFLQRDVACVYGNPAYTGADEIVTGPSTARPATEA